MTGLTNEELITMRYYDNPLVVNKNSRWYKKQYQRLKKIHYFTWDGRNKLTPARKSQITKLYNKHYIALGKIERGVYTFVKSTRAQKKRLSSQFIGTNKGFIYNHPVAHGTRRITKIVGRGKSTRLLDKIIIYDQEGTKILTKLTFYIPFNSDTDRLNHDLFIDFVRDFLKPDFISVAVNGYAGKFERPHGSAITSGDAIKNMIGKSGEEVYTGIYIIYYKKMTKKGLATWTKTINKKITMLQHIKLPY